MTKKRAQRAATSGYLVAGRLRGGRLASIDGLDVVVLNAGIRKRIDVAHGRLTRDAAFEIAFELALQGDDLPDLAVEIRHGEKLLATSGVRIDVPPGRVVIDVEVPGTARAARAEYEALGDRLRAAGLDGTKALDVKARPDDLAYLARKTQWDARAIAMFILAGRLSEQGAPAARLEPDLFYALFRSGVPAQANAVLRVAPANARAAWAAAADAGVIAPRTEGQLKEAVARFQVLVQAETLSAPRIPGASPLGEVLAVSFRKNAALEATVVKLLARFGSDAKRFWTAVEQELGADERRRLALDSDLAALTLHNAPLMQAVRQTALPDDAAGLEPLAEAGLAQPQAWEALLKNVPIPAPVTGETEDTRRARYAELLAEQVRLAFPLTALARRVDDGVAAVNGKSRAAVSDFLRKQNGKYRLGEEPLVRYLERTGEKLDPNLSREIRRLERVHQLTPNDPAMDALLRADLDSAYRIAQLEEAGFVERFAKSLGADVAASIHSKAREVHNATVNVVLGYQTAQAGVVIGAGNAPIVQPQVSQQAMTNANAAVAATLETLFGELDYCACEHCRSVLGPAAYLVDLLALCDPVAGDIPAGKRAPIAELRRRRPDIEHLPLTCNNTNTAVPVIDLVNETLEYFVVAAPAEQPGKPAMSLDGFKGYSTSGDVSQQDLLAEPQHVRAAAYAGLQGAFFPLALPFNEPLEAERRYLAPFDRSLAGVMEAMRVNDDLERGGATPYGWRDILMEELSLSRQQHALLTDRTITVRQLYGFPAAGVGDPVVPPELRNVKQFTRRLGLSFEELTALLRTRFVNPNIWVLPLAERLGVTLARIKEFAVTADTAANNTAFEAGVSAGLDAALYGGSIAAWTRLHAPTILGLLTLFDTAAQPDPCNFDAMEFRYGDPAANGGAVLDLEFVRLIRFVRLWKALSWPATAGTEDDGARGWTIAETDAALTALYPVNQLPLSGVDATDLQRLDDGMRQALLRLGSMVRVLRLLEIGDRAELPSLLACFAPMQGIEEGALYRRLFMSAEFLRLYPAFQPDTAGRALPDPAVTLATQAEAMRAACGLAGDDWTALQGSGRFPANTTLANVPTNAQLQALVGHVPTAREAEYVLRFVRTDTVSAVYRRAWLARTLGISPRELESLAAATGLDPFADPGVVTAATPPNPAESFVRLVLELRGSGLALAEALLAFFNLDLLAASGASEAAARGVAAAVRSDLADVDRALVVTDDPDSAVAQALLASVYDATVADRYIAHINRRARVDVEYVAPGGALPAAVPQAGDGGLDYDDFAQRLGYSKGVMPAAVRDALTAPGLNQPQAFNDAVLALYAQSRVFLQQLGPDALLQAHDAFQASAAADPARRRQLLADLTTALKPVRKRLAALARGTAALRLTGDWPAAALTDAAALPANRDAAQPGLFDLLALDRRGVVGEFFFGALGAVADVRDGAAGALDYRAAGARSLPANAANPGQPIAARWRGFVRVPAPGAFTLFIEADAAAAPALWIEGSSIALQPVSAGLWRTAGAQSFDAGRLIAFTLEATGLGARATLSVQTATVQRAVVAADDLFDAAIMQDFVSTLGRLQRAELLRTKLSLNEAEILFLLRAPALRITVDARPWAWLGVVPVLAPAAAVAAPLGRVLSTLLAYLRVRRELGAEAEEMLALLGDPAATLSDAASAFMRRSSWKPPRSMRCSRGSGSSPAVSPTGTRCARSRAWPVYTTCCDPCWR